MLEGLTARLGRQPSRLLDPFAGTAASISAASQLGIPSVGIELSPLGLLIAQVRLGPPQDLDKTVDLAEEWARSTSPAKPTCDEELAGWIGRSNARALTGYLYRLAHVADPSKRRFLALAISGALRPSSVWLPGSIKPQIDPTRKPPRIGDQLIRVARSLRRDCLLEHPRLLASAEIVLGDATQLRYRESFDAILTSPPYFVTYDYFDVQRLTYLAFGWPVRNHDQVGRSSGIEQDGHGFLPPTALNDWYFVKFNHEGTVLGRALRLYVQALERHLRVAYRALSPRSVAAYAVADSVRLGEQFPLVAAMAQLAKRVGFTTVEIEPRAITSRRILPPGRSRRTGRFTRGHTYAIREAVIFATK